MALSDMAVRRAKATGKAYALYDTLGLSLAVTANGGKSWHFRYYWLNKRKRISFGTYPEVSLVEARSPRDPTFNNVSADAPSESAASPVDWALRLPARAARTSLTMISTANSITSKITP